MAGEWVNVRDRLPDYEVEVLAFDDDDNYWLAARTATNKEGEVWCKSDDDEYEIKDIRFWIPLPERPA